MSLVDVQKAESFPINGVNEYSPKDGNPQIQFMISGAENQLLDLGSIRLIYTLKLVTGTASANSTAVGATTFRFNNQYVLGNVDGGGDAELKLDTPLEATLDDRTGCCSIWDSITINDALNNTLEQIRNYGRMMASVNSLTNSLDDFQGYTQMRYGAYGARKLTEQIATNADIPQCHKIYSGLLMSKPIPFSMMGQLRLTLNLSNSSFVMYGTQAGTGVNGIGSGGTYQVRDVKIVYNLITLPQAAIVPKAGIGYKHFGAFNQTIQAPSYQNQYNFNVSNALTVLNTFLPSSWVNNYSQNSLLTRKLGNSTNSYEVTARVDIHNSAFLKNNIRFPLDFNIDERTFNDVSNGKNGYDVQRAYYYVDSLKPYYSLNHTLISPATEGLGSTGTLNEADVDVSVVVN